MNGPTVRTNAAFLHIAEQRMFCLGDAMRNKRFELELLYRSADAFVICSIRNRLTSKLHFPAVI
ncbi:MAG: hypothetical protein ACJ8MH_04200 [Povalibacter sp.]